MISVPLIMHRVPGVDPRFVVPTDALTRLFREFGVALDFEKGDDLPQDPKTWRAYVDVVNRWHPTPLPVGSPAHLFVGKEWDDEGAGTTNGVLVTPERSAIGVFTGSIALRDPKAPAALFLQVIAHEICHLVHLTHEDGNPDLPTAECPDSVRSGEDPKLAWKFRQRPCPKGLDAFPLSRRSEERLATAAPSEVLPWGEKFQAIGTEVAFHRRRGEQRIA